MNKRNSILTIVAVILTAVIGCEVCLYFGYDLYFSDHGVFIRKRAYIATYENMSESELRQKAQTGDEDARAQLGVCMFSKHYDETEAYNLAKQSADFNCARGQNFLGIAYEFGIYVTPDYKLAFEWYEKSANKKFPEALFNIGRCYANGLGVPKDINKGVEYFEQSALQGYPYAQLALGDWYLHEIPDSSSNASKGVEWLTLAAEQGLPIAQYELSKLYYKGENVTANYEKAKEWCNKAASQGYPEAKIDMENKYNSKDN